MAGVDVTAEILAEAGLSPLPPRPGLRSVTFDGFFCRRLYVAGHDVTATVLDLAGGSDTDAIDLYLAGSTDIAFDRLEVGKLTMQSADCTAPVLALSPDPRAELEPKG